MAFQIRELQLPQDYPALAQLLSQHWSEPASAARLEEDDAKMYTTGQTWRNEQGLLAGYDRFRRVAVNSQDELLGYVWIWRAPWTEPGYVCLTLVVDKEHRKLGIGEALMSLACQWAIGIGASSLLSEVWDDQPEDLDFARQRGFIVERHAYQSVLPLQDTTLDAMEMEPEAILAFNGLRLLTLTDEPGEESERKLYQLSIDTMRDIPSFMGDVPDFTEWRKWNLKVDGFKSELVLIAADGDRFIGMTNVLHNEATNGLYHEYTCVDRAYRGNKVALALKLEAIRVGKRVGADYIRTDNDSMNAPILSINRKLGFVPLRGTYRMLASIEKVREALKL